MPKRLFVFRWGVSLLALALLACATAYGQAAAQSRIIGEVVSVAAAAKTITVKTDKGESIAVTVGEKTLYLRVPPGEKDLKNAARISLADIGVGDRVLARGPASDDPKSLSAGSVIIMTKADIAKKQEHDHAEWQRRGITGKITEINAAAKEFTVSVRAAEGTRPIVVESADKVQDFRRYAPDSVRFSDARPSSFAELKVGDQVRVLGEKNADGTHIKPEAIVSGSFRTIAATVSSIDAAAGEIKITDLDTKKPVTVHVKSDTAIRRLPPMMAAMLARRLNPQAAGANGPAPGGRPGQGGQMPQRQFQGRGPGGPGGPAGPGGPGGGRGGVYGGGQGMDFNQVLERAPVVTLAELKPGDALIISSTAGADPASVTAITLVAGVEPLLTAAPQRGQQIGGAWTFDMGLPE